MGQPPMSRKFAIPFKWTKGGEGRDVEVSGCLEREEDILIWVESLSKLWYNIL